MGTDYVGDVPHPGYFIQEELDARGWGQVDLAYILGISAQALNPIIKGKRAITPDMARALGDAFDVPGEFFANLQKLTDLALARAPDPDVARKAKLQSVFPIREMIRRGWLTDTKGPILEAEVAQFFEEKSLDRVPYFPHAAKKTNYVEVTPTHLAWLYRVRQVANEIVVPRYSKKKLEGAVEHFRHFRISPEDARHVPGILADCGVRFVAVESLPGAKIDGCCFWLGKSPVIGMSLLYDRIDNFWFVLTHEIEHVLREHGKREEILDVEVERNSPDIPEEEKAANAAAQEFCVPKEEMDSFYRRKNPYFSEKDVLLFAKRIQVRPGLVAGQLRRRLERWNLFNSMLEKTRHHVISSAEHDGWGHVAPVNG